MEDEDDPFDFSYSSKLPISKIWVDKNATVTPSSAGLKNYKVLLLIAPIYLF